MSILELLKQELDEVSEYTLEDKYSYPNFMEEKVDAAKAIAQHFKKILKELEDEPN